jgi:hypothetical protein
MPNCPELILYKGSETATVLLDKDLEPVVEQARKLTSDFFANRHFQAPFLGRTAWAFYDRFFHDIALPYTRYQSLLLQCSGASKLETKNLPSDLFPLIKYLCSHHQIPWVDRPQKTSVKSYSTAFLHGLWRIFLGLYSMGSLAYLISHKSQRRIAVWTGDYISGKTNLDPRLGDLEPQLQAHDFQAIPFIRSTGVSAKNSLKNFFVRKGPLIYYECLDDIFFSCRTLKKANFTGQDWIETAFYGLYRETACSIEKRTQVWKYLFQKMHLKSFIPWFLSSRTASLLWAAKDAKIPSIGFMHGVSVISFMGHEFMKEYKGEPIGTDYFGTWSELWKDYFDKNSRIYPNGAIEISGPLKNLPFTKIPAKNSSEKIKVYFVAEAHLPVKEIVPYLQALMPHPKYELYFKIRPFGRDKFWQAFLKHPLYDKNRFYLISTPTPQCFSDADVVIGTHSTAVLEALAMNKPFLFFNTKKWGDYFGRHFFGNQQNQFWVSGPDEIVEKIEALLADPESLGLAQLHNKLFGDKSGSAWIIEKLKQNI